MHQEEGNDFLSFMFSAQSFALKKSYFLYFFVSFITFPDRIFQLFCYKCRLEVLKDT